jgi:alpha-glucosidase
VGSSVSDSLDEDDNRAMSRETATDSKAEVTNNMTITIERARFPGAKTRTLSGSEWWRSAVTYQIYVRSFYDSDGDGNGDLNGIIEKMDYLEYLGVDAIWLTPFFKSPGLDQGYDPASYHMVDRKFGDNSDLRRLVERAHRSNIKVILDLVMNHTSDQHPWFLNMLREGVKEQRMKSGYDFKVNPVSNAYVFRPEDPDHPGKPPNNWMHFMGNESAWTKTPTGEWYLHRFTRHQPDLDLRNPLVRSHFCKVVQRWVGDQKIDGIRLDVLDHLFHDPQLRSFDRIANPASDHYLANWDWAARYLIEDESVDLAREISRAIRAANPNAVSIGELHYGEAVSDFRYYGRFLTEGEIDVPFNFSLLDTVQRLGANAKAWKTVIDRYLAALPNGACPNFVVSNHDQTMRLADRVGGENIRAVTMALLCLGDEGGSNVFVYNGDEIGMEKGNIINESNMNDPVGQLQGLSVTRDHVRTGLVWSAGETNGGYSENPAPWLPAGQTIYGRGVNEQINDFDSQLCFTRDVLALRKENAALRFGKYVPYDSNDDELLCYGREMAGQDSQKLLMIFNFSEQPKIVRLSPQTGGEILRSTDYRRTHERVATNLNLQPHEGCVVRLVALGG